MTTPETLFTYEPTKEELDFYRPAVTQIRHGHDGISMVELTFRGSPYFIMLNTTGYELEEADRLCAKVPEWWSPDIDTNILWPADQILDVA